MGSCVLQIIAFCFHLIFTQRPNVFGTPTSPRRAAIFLPDSAVSTPTCWTHLLKSRDLCRKQIMQTNVNTPHRVLSHLLTKTTNKVASWENWFSNEMKANGPGRTRHMTRCSVRATWCDVGLNLTHSSILPFLCEWHISIHLYLAKPEKLQT